MKILLLELHCSLDVDDELHDFRRNHINGKVENGWQDGYFITKEQVEQIVEALTGSFNMMHLHTKAGDNIKKALAILVEGEK